MMKGPEPTLSLQIPASLDQGRYVLQDKLGQGATAQVFRAWDNRLEVERAVKVMIFERAARTRLRQRFINEARVLARMRHPHVITVYDVGEEEGHLYFVMDLVTGGTLADRMSRDGPLPPVEATRCLLQVLDALEHAHAEGLVHRDIKPHNLLLDHGAVRVADFGLARLSRSRHALTRTGVVMGTWAYMAPEQRTNAKGVDARADIYSSGATLFALLTAEDPFDLSATDLPSALLTGIPEALHPVLVRSTRRDPEERYPTAAEMRLALAACEGLLPSTPDPGGLGQSHEARSASGMTMVPEPSLDSWSSLSLDAELEPDELELELELDPEPIEPLRPADQAFFQRPTTLLSRAELQAGEPPDLEPAPPLPTKPPAGVDAPQPAWGRLAMGLAGAMLLLGAAGLVIIGAAIYLLSR